MALVGWLNLLLNNLLIFHLTGSMQSLGNVGHFGFIQHVIFSQPKISVCDYILSVNQHLIRTLSQKLA